MKLDKLWAIVVLCVAAVQTAHARLGDTEEELAYNLRLLDLDHEI